MHEIGMLYQTAQTALKYAEENSIDSVKTVTVELGELSGALPRVFEMYFPYIVSQYPRLKDAELEIKTIPGEALCSECRALYNVMKQEGVCPNCRSRDKTILGGTEVRLLSIAY